MSDTKNVRLGVCKIFYKGVDLGYTQGGVEVSVSTDSHKVNVDQFGKTSINEYIMGRECKVKVPLAETTLENLVAIMPGATLTDDGTGVKAAGKFTFAAQPADGDAITVGATDRVFVFKTAATAANHIAIGGTLTATLTAAATLLNASADPIVARSTYTATATELQVSYDTKSVDGNSFVLASSKPNAAVTAMTGGVNSKRRVDVTNGIGSDMLAMSGELRLHPKDRADADTSDDFVIPRAGTAGGLQFAYKVDAERVFSCEFTAYPDPLTSKLFYVGDNF